MKSDYSTPLLTKIYNTLGFLLLVVAVALMGFGFYCSATDKLPAALLQIFALAGWSIVAALVSFGVAEAVDFMGRTAHRATQIQSLLASGETALQNRLRAIEGVLNSINANEIMAQLPTPTSAGFRYQVDGADKGPFTASEMAAFRAANVIREDTPVLREGELEWRTYSHYFYA